MRDTIPLAKRREQEEMARRIAEYEATHGPVKQYDSTANAGYNPNVRDFRISKKRGLKD